MPLAVSKGASYDVPSMMGLEELHFLVEEYRDMWRDHGLWNILPGLIRTEGGIPSSKFLEKTRDEIGDCRRCGLCHARKQIVFGNGNPKADLVFIDEAPGLANDTIGLPLAGETGSLLTKIIEAMGYTVNGVYVTSLVKCCPPKNRPPSPEEIATCFPFLKAQLTAIGPRIIVAFGETTARVLTGKVGSATSLRGRFHPLVWDPSVSVMTTFSPAYLLTTPTAKRQVWEEMKLVKSRLARSQ